MTASGPEADGEVRLLLQTVWDLLSEGEHWPTYTAVDRALHREHGIDADPVIARTPVAWLSGGRPEGGAGARPDASMSLTLDGALLCEASCAAIEVVARAAGLAAAAEASASGSEPAAVEFSDAGADVPDSQVRGVARASGLLLHAEPWTGHVLLWEGGWRMAADRRARRFAGVTGVDEFLAVRAAGEPALDAVTGGRWVVLGRRWRLGARLGRGGFGQVFRATGEDGTLAAVKLVPKEPGADRELLFADLGSARNVMPVLDSGETATAS